MVKIEPLDITVCAGGEGVEAQISWASGRAVYAALGGPGTAMDGQSLLAGGTVAGHAGGRPRESVYTPEQEAAVEERLRSLGYFE